METLLDLDVVVRGLDAVTPVLEETVSAELIADSSK
jgi:hypothetical protein